MAKNKLRIYLKELFTRVVKPIRAEQLYTNDVDNLYPNRVEAIESNSPTAQAAANELRSMIIGRGFEDEELNKKIVNPHTGLTAYELLQEIADSIKTHRAAYIYVNYNAEGEVTVLDVLKYRKIRIGKEDTKGNYGRIYERDWDEVSGRFKGFNKDDNARYYYPFNRNLKVINAQRKADSPQATSPEDLIRNYRGQVFMITLDKTEVYPFAFLHSAMNQADSEYRIGVYDNSNLRRGFLDKTIIALSGVDDTSMQEFTDNVADWMGAENSESVMVIDRPKDLALDEKFIETISLKGTYDAKRFSEARDNAESAIRKAYLNIPKVLIDPSEGSLGTSGKAFEEAQRLYSDKTMFIRDRIASELGKLQDLDWTIKPLVDEDITK